jgi:hypothetical protein
MARRESMKQFKLWPEQWPEIKELQEKVTTRLAKDYFDTFD